MFFARCSFAAPCRDRKYRWKSASRAQCCADKAASIASIGIFYPGDEIQQHAADLLLVAAHPDRIFQRVLATPAEGLELFLEQPAFPIETDAIYAQA
jgi:hypothetical protein